MHKGAFVCQACEKVVPYAQDRYTRRVEYVRQDSNHRMATFTEKWLCKKCAEIEVAHRRQRTPVGQQTALL